MALGMFSLWLPIIVLYGIVSITFIATFVLENEERNLRARFVLLVIYIGLTVIIARCYYLRIVLTGQVSDVLCAD